MTVRSPLLLLCIALPAIVRAQDSPGHERRRLDHPQSIGGVSCGSTGRAFAEIYANGALRECPLARDTIVARHELPAGTWILLDERRRLRSAWLLSDLRLGGQLCHGKGFKEFLVTFHDDGALKSCYLARDTVISGVPCLHGSFWTEIRGGSKSVATFARDGSLTGCQLAHDVSISGRQYRKWDRWAAHR